ncbi:hypothetical protein [Chromobacterium sphagni]|uniref:hypothetical protein n=1 Tax=Chromobacterium sphagni TaxID=1903179 RepID=UPI0008DA1252|nr:hypothetical protein [Chromobacterium sphagni]
MAASSLAAAAACLRDRAATCSASSRLAAACNLMSIAWAASCSACSWLSVAKRALSCVAVASSAAWRWSWPRCCHSVKPASSASAISRVPT